MFAEGRVSPVTPANNHPEHKQIHNAYMSTEDYQLWPQAYKNRFEQHNAEHDAAEQSNQIQPQQNFPGQQDASDQDRGIRGTSVPSVGVA